MNNLSASRTSRWSTGQGLARFTGRSSTSKGEDRVRRASLTRFLDDPTVACFKAAERMRLTAAELLGLADELGTIQAGKLADLVVCAGDPLADITLLGKPENVVAVVQAGVVRKNTMLAGDAGSCDRDADADSSGPSRR